jgi:hypothetical protein
MADDNWLKNFGFNAMRLPRRDVNPNDVLFRGNGRFDTKVGIVSMVVSNDDPVPEPSAGEPSAEISRQVTRKLEAKFGFQLLGKLIGAGAGKLGIDTGYKRARTLDVTYEDVVIDSIPVIALQAWLEEGKVTAPEAVQVWLNDDKLACITAVLRSDKLSVVANNESGGKIDVSVPEISGIVSGEANVQSSSEDSTKITFTGKAPIAFGFQAFQLIYEGNVSFGLKQVRRIEKATAEELADEAWTADSEIGELREDQVPAA